MGNRLIAIALLLLVGLVVAVPAHATFPGTNGRIAFVEAGTGEMDDPGTPTYALSIAAPARDAEVPLRSRQLLFCDPSASTGCRLSEVRSPSYSPDGRRIVFDGGERIAIAGANGDGLIVLPAVTENDGDPAFSPDGSRIVFTGRNDAGGTDLYSRVREDARPPRAADRRRFPDRRQRLAHLVRSRLATRSRVAADPLAYATRRT